MTNALMLGLQTIKAKQNNALKKSSEHVPRYAKKVLYIFQAGVPTADQFDGKGVPSA